MPKTNSKTNSFLQFEHIERRQSESFNLDTKILDLLEQYPRFVGETEGHAPTKDLVVEKALAFIFDKDQAFKKYLAKINSDQPGGRAKKGKNAERNEQADGAQTNLRPAA